MYFLSLHLSKVSYGLFLLSLPALPGNCRQGFDMGLWLLPIRLGDSHPFCMSLDCKLKSMFFLWGAARRYDYLDVLPCQIKGHCRGLKVIGKSTQVLGETPQFDVTLGEISHRKWDVGTEGLRFPIGHFPAQAEFGGNQEVRGSTPGVPPGLGLATSSGRGGAHGSRRRGDGGELEAPVEGD